MLDHGAACFEKKVLEAALEVFVLRPERSAVEYRRGVNNAIQRKWAPSGLQRQSKVQIDDTPRLHNARDLERLTLPPFSQRFLPPRWPNSRSILFALDVCVDFLKKAAHGLNSADGDEFHAAVVRYHTELVLRRKVKRFSNVFWYQNLEARR
jgi:hypothetical protein